MEGYDSTDSDTSHPRSILSPVPDENLMGHPFFRCEYELPWAEYEPLMASRRISETSPPPQSPPAVPIITSRAGRRAKGRASVTERNPSRRGSVNVAGFLGGESDSSELTSGDEAMDIDSIKPSRRNSVITGTPTEGTMEDEDDAIEASSKHNIITPVPGNRSSVLAPIRGRRRGRPPKALSRGGRGTPTGGRRGRGRRYAKIFLTIFIYFTFRQVTPVDEFSPAIYPYTVPSRYVCVSDFNKLTFDFLTRLHLSLSFKFFSTLGNHIVNLSWSDLSSVLVFPTGYHCNIAH